MVLKALSLESSAHIHEVEVQSPGSSDVAPQLSDPPRMAPPPEVYLEKHTQNTDSSVGNQRSKRLPQTQIGGLFPRLGVSRKPPHSAEPLPSSKSQATESAHNERPSWFAAARKKKVSVLVFVDERRAMCLIYNLS